MHRNTYLLVLFLAVLAALVIGVNFGRRFTRAPTSPPASPTPTPTLAATPETSRLTNTYCGLSLDYPRNFTKLETASGSAVLINPQNPAESVVLICQKDIPRPPLPPEKIETVTFGTTSAKLYHDVSAKDGKPTDSLIFRHPKNSLDIFIGGYGAVFNEVIRSLKILP